VYVRVRVRVRVRVSERLANLQIRDSPFKHKIGKSKFAKHKIFTKGTLEE